MKIITSHLAKYLNRIQDINYDIILDPTNVENIILLLKNKKQITIYDRTCQLNYLEKKIFYVNDHINRTGANPLTYIKFRKNSFFIDLQKLYKQNKNGIITNCCGLKLNNKYNFPSHMLCHITIIARLLKIKNIYAYLINIY